MDDLKAIAKRVFLETLSAIDPALVTNQNLRFDGHILTLGSEEIALDNFDEVVLIGMGKASVKMGVAVESLLGERIGRGILVTDRRSIASVRSEVIVAGHPLPDEYSLIAGKRITELVQSCGSHSLIIFMISGGGSSLVELPVSEEISLEDLRVINKILVGSGASIREINIVRKSLSRIKGGGLGYLARNSKCVVLYFSDVNPGDLRSVASNPILPDDVGSEDVLTVMNKFSLVDRFPASAVKAITQRGAAISTFEWRASAKPVTMLLLDSSIAMRAAARLARKYGFQVEVDADSIEGEYQAIADRLINKLRNLRSSFPGKPVCVISGGEVLCRVQADGVGGRNQEFVLYSATRLADCGIDRAAVLSCGTDGIDGNSAAAGAVCDAEAIAIALRRKLDASNFIYTNDSHSFFKRLGGLVVTGPTGNNVRDLRVLMAQ